MFPLKSAVVHASYELQATPLLTFLLWPIYRVKTEPFGSVHFHFNISYPILVTSSKPNTLKHLTPPPSNSYTHTPLLPTRCSGRGHEMKFSAI